MSEKNIIIADNSTKQKLAVIFENNGNIAEVYNTAQNRTEVLAENNYSFGIVSYFRKEKNFGRQLNKLKSEGYTHFVIYKYDNNFNIEELK